MRTTKEQAAEMLDAFHTESPAYKVARDYLAALELVDAVRKWGQCPADEELTKEDYVTLLACELEMVHKLAAFDEGE